MTRLAVTILDARPSAQTAAPGVTFRLRIESLSETRVHAMALKCQVRIESRARRYTRDEAARLYELFGDVAQWKQTLRGLVWTNASLVVASFDRQIEADLDVACTYDLEVASAKYLHAIRDGDVPLTFMFSGTIFGGREAGMTFEPVAWDVDAAFRMPARVWRSAMDQFFPGGGWVRLQRDTLDRLQAFRGRQALVSWDDTIDRLLARAAPEEIA